LADEANNLFAPSPADIAYYDSISGILALERSGDYWNSLAEALQYPTRVTDLWALALSSVLSDLI